VETGVMVEGMPWLNQWMQHWRCLVQNGMVLPLW